MTRTTRWLLGGTALLGLAGALFVANHYLGRPDRIAAASQQVELDKVRDELLRYELEHGALPATMHQLVPAYLRDDQIEDSHGPRYRYDPKKRRIVETNGPLVRGLITYTMKPRGYDLPPPDAPLCGQPRPPVVVDLPPDPEPATQLAPPVQPDPDFTITPKPASPPERPSLAAQFVVPVAPDLADPPAGCLVFEAELYTEINYGWEVHADKDCAGGAYLHAKEGIANGPGQTRYQTGDFYNVRATKDVTALRYHVRVPKAGNYYVYGRMWTTDTHCSNYVCAAFDQGGPYVGGMGNTTPFRWAWSPMRENPVYLTAGDHFLHCFIHEDGVRVDQFIMSPREISGSTPYRPNLVPGRDTAWQRETGPLVSLMFDLRSMVISPQLPPECNLVIRRLRPSETRAALRVVLERVLADGKDLVLADGEVELGKLQELTFLPLSFKNLELAKLPRKEYLLRAELRGIPEEGKTGRRLLAAAHIPLIKPFVWEAFGPGRFLGSGQAGSLDGDGVPKAADKRAWKPFEDKSFDHFGVLDFGVHCCGNSNNPPQYQTIYARTRIKAPKTDTYLFKLQNDDQMLLWLDGKLIYQNDEQLPVTRNPGWLPLRLEAGEHRLRMRVNQYEGRWQACLRIRTQDDNVSDVEGLERAADGK